MQWRERHGGACVCGAVSVCGDMSFSGLSQENSLIVLEYYSLSLEYSGVMKCVEIETARIPSRSTSKRCTVPPDGT